MVDTDTITKERLREWSERLSAEHSTSVLLIAVGHDHTSGQLTICYPEDLDDDFMMGGVNIRHVHASKETR